MIELRWRPAVLEQDVDNIIEVGDRACVLQYREEINVRYFPSGDDIIFNWQDVGFSDD